METDREKEARRSQEEWGLKTISRKLETRDIQANYCYLVLNHSLDMQRTIFRNALNTNRILKDIFTNETFTYQECYKVKALDQDEVINTFLNPQFSGLFKKYENQPLNIVWRDFIRTNYQAVIFKNKIGLTKYGEEMKAKTKGV